MVYRRHVNGLHRLLASCFSAMESKTSAYQVDLRAGIFTVGVRIHLCTVFTPTKAMCSAKVSKTYLLPDQILTRV
jgi:hypothetical protein